MPRSKEPAISANVVYFVGIIAVIALIGVFYLYSSAPKVGRGFDVDTGSTPSTTAVPTVSVGITGGESCLDLVDGMVISSNAMVYSVCAGRTYSLPSGILITGNDNTIYCTNDYLVGSGNPNSAGIKVQGQRNTIIGCDISGYGKAFYITTNGNQIKFNTIHDSVNSGTDAAAVYIGPTVKDTIFSNNIVRNNPVMGIWLDNAGTKNSIRDSQFISNGGNSIRLYKSSNTTIVNNTIDGLNAGDGIAVLDSSYIWILSNYIHGKVYGITLEKVGYAEVDKNIVDNNQYGGLDLNIPNHHLNVTNNTFSNNDGVGMYAVADDSIFRDNNIYGNNEGVQIYYGSRITVSDNIINNNWYGVGIYSTVNSLTLTGNKIYSNTNYGIRSDGSGTRLIANNDIRYNGIGTTYAGVEFSSTSATMQNNLICNNAKDVKCSTSTVTFSSDRCDTVSSTCGFTACPYVCQATGSLKASSSPSGASLYVDSLLRGVTPITVVNLIPGIHSVLFKKTGYYDFPTSVTITENQEYPLGVTLAFIPTPSPTPCTGPGCDEINPTVRPCRSYCVVGGKKVCCNSVDVDLRDR